MKKLMKGNEALGEGAIKAGCAAYFGYPITPQNELTEYMSKRMLEEKRVFLQSESELAAINMVLGASAAGVKAMTSSSSPGISLKQEGLSYMAGCELPALIVNVQRGGPGLGNIAGSQADYFQATKGGGHGDYHLIVLAPSSVQEMFEMPAQAFALAEKYRNPVMILADGVVGQILEPMEEHNIKLQKKYKVIKEQEQRCQKQNTEKADIILVAYGTSARVCYSAMLAARKKGLSVGLLRPLTLWPFPVKAIAELTGTAKAFLTVEMSAGQMVEDVKLAVNGRKPVHFYGRAGGGMPTEEEILKEIEKI